MSMLNKALIGKRSDRSEIVRRAPFAAQLRTLAENYQSKAIMALVHRYRAGYEDARTEKPPV